MNIGAEYFQFLMKNYFAHNSMKSLDIKTIIEKLKLIEKDCQAILDKKLRKENKIKYQFIPIETHQMLEFLSNRKEEELK